MGSICRPLGNEIRVGSGRWGQYDLGKNIIIHSSGEIEKESKLNTREEERKRRNMDKQPSIIQEQGVQVRDGEIKREKTTEERILLLYFFSQILFI